MKKRLSTSLLLLIVVTGLGMIASGSYIHIKAWVGQLLIERAWQKSAQTRQANKPWPWMDTLPIAKLRVPGLGIEQTVLSGDSGQALAFAPGHRTGSAHPGNPGISLISGHRDTHFRFMQRLKKGDLITLEKLNGELISYKISTLKIVTENYLFYPGNDQEVLILATCWPFDSISNESTQRYLAIAEPV